MNPIETHTSRSVGSQGFVKVALPGNHKTTTRPISPFRVYTICLTTSSPLEPILMSDYSHIGCLINVDLFQSSISKWGINPKWLIASPIRKRGGLYCRKAGL